MKKGRYYVEVCDWRGNGSGGFVGKAGRLRKTRPQAFVKEYEAQAVAEDYVQKRHNTEFPNCEIVRDNEATSRSLLIEVFVWKARGDDEVDDDVAVFGIA